MPKETFNPGCTVDTPPTNTLDTAPVDSANESTASSTMTPIVTQINALKHEIRHRKQFYPRLVANGKMTQAKADEFIKHMEDAVKTLDWVRRLTS